MTRLTVIIPVKNGEDFLEATLQSLSDQSFQEFEVLIWDNGSTDRTVDILREWIPARLTGRIVTGDPLPYDECLAKLVQTATSPFLARLDADDIAMPDRFRDQVRELEADPELAAVGGQMEFIDINGTVFGNAPQFPTDFPGILARMMCQSPLPHPGVTLRREAVIDVGNYLPLQPTEDLDLWMRLATKYKLTNLSSLVLQYRRHDRSVTELEKAKGTHTQMICSRLCKNSNELFGIPPDDYEMLFLKRKRTSLLPLRRIAKRIAKRCNCEISDVLKSPEFCNSCRILTSNRDMLSKAWIFGNARDRSRSITWQLTQKLQFFPGIRWIRAAYRNFAARHKINSWRRRLNKDSRLIEGLDIRGLAQWQERISIGRHVAIERGLLISFQECDEAEASLEIAEGVFIGRNSVLSVCASISIGPQVLIGANCYIASNNHRFATRALPIREQGYDAADVNIGEGVWLGTHVVVLAGTKIGRGAVIAAGAVVTKSVPAFEIWGGVPARKIGERP